jgi:tetratricopeptide (TPR) repeat protein
MPDGSSTYARELAARLLDQGRVIEGESALRLALYDDPEDAELYLALAECLVAQGKRGAALDAFVAAVEFEPELASAHAGIGRCDIHPMRRAGAYAEAVRLAPGSLDYRLGLAEGLIAAGEIAAAIEQLDSAVELAPGDLEVANTTGELMLEARCFEQAAALFESAIGGHPIAEESGLELARSYRGLGRALGGVGRHTEAMEALKAALFLADDPLTEPDDNVTYPGEATLPG